jgi:exopolysaccharide biosynthesis polyprenyl glycosylphosphotransferase
MFSNRFRGLVNLHAAVVLFVAVFLFWVYGHTGEYLRFAQLLPGLHLLPYMLCVTAGMILSARHVWNIAPRFHELSWVDAVRMTTRQVLYTAVVLFAFMFAFKDRTISRLFVGSYLILAWGVLLFVNRRLPRFLSGIAFEQRHRAPTLFVGSRHSLGKLHDWLASREFLGLLPLGLISDHEQRGNAGDLPLLGGLGDLPRLIDQNGILQVIVLEIPRETAEGLFILETCQNKGCRVLIHSNLAEQLNHPLVTVVEQGHQFYMLQEEPLEDPINRLLKRCFDLALALPVTLFILPPLTVIVWLGQRLQAPGPLIFAQERTGYGQKVFRILKYRTMYASESGGDREEEQARRGDNRVFGFGRLLRRTSLDEFPQFYNVLRGEMSVVGPRPHMVAHDEKFNAMIKAYRTRFFAKPGITGLAQCSGLRGEIVEPALIEKRVQVDIDYVSQWSIWLDIQLVLKTIRVVFFPPKTAY